MTRSFLLLTAWLALAGLALADDWPQWRGPQRTGISKDTGLLKSWPKDGPKLLWTFEEAGIGYGGPAVVGNRLYILGGDKTQESLFALDVQSGKRAWSAPVGGFYNNPYGGGPRSTPTVDGEVVFALDANGDLGCFRTDKGTRLWTVSLIKQLGGGRPNWGYSESPLVDGDQVVCTPGGRNGTLAALDKKTGKEIWRSKGWTDGAQYASVVVSTANNTRQYVQRANESVAGIDPATGKMLWRAPQKRATATIPTPIAFDNFVYSTAGYGVGCSLLELTSPTEAREVYTDKNNKNIVNKHGGVILLDGHIYGHSDGRGGWTCQNVKTGEVVWRHNKFPMGSIAYADGHFYCYAETDGSLALIEASTAGWKEKARFKIPKESDLPRPPSRKSNNIWTHPVIANGRLYLRNMEYLFCYDIKDAAP